MKAAIFHENGGPEVIRTETVPTPAPGPDEVLIRVHASSLNHLDLWARRGLPGVPMPHIGGSDIAGAVEAVGERVSRELLVDRVVVDPSLNFSWYEAQAKDQRGRLRFGVIGEHTQGGHAEYALVPAENVVPLPESTSFRTAAAAGLAYVTAWRGLTTRAGVRAGDRVLITGASGGVAIAAVQIAKHLGATVYAITSGKRNVDRVAALGADVAYDRLSEDWAAALHADTGKAGVDVVLDSVGGPMWSACIRALAAGGRLVTYGATAGPESHQDIRRIFWKQLSILGTTMGSPREFRDVMRLVFDGVLEPVVDDVLSLDQVKEGHERLERGEVFGKLVIEPQDPEGRDAGLIPEPS
jgi:NADPH:quinone reductase-like Zn-dependent oxidoreductase